jgi:gentisate 1,2-dioxygenase
METTMKTMKWENFSYFEYLAAADPTIPEVPIGRFPAELHLAGPSRIVHFDHSKELMTDYPATSPNCLASFVRIELGNTLTTEIQASSHLFYVLRGRGEIKTLRGSTKWAHGDIITLPASGSITFRAEKDGALFWVNDSPVLHYLDAKPVTQTFNPVRYEAAWLRTEVRRTAAEPGAAKRNRIGILLANPACPLTRTITPTLWSLLEVVPAGMILPPHRHNSVALDLAITGCSNGYTLLGREIDAEGNIKNPVRVNWEDGSAFTTPPMLWHEHHNESAHEAWVLPVQDAGPVTYGRILEIKFAGGGPQKLECPNDWAFGGARPA